MVSLLHVLIKVGKTGLVAPLIFMCCTTYDLCLCLHRDLKPGNLLVNSNCLLKICDFGFARAIEPDPNTAMTLEVVTQYYRAPELLAGCKHYDTAIDMWSVGCILAELLGRKILFEASSPEAQVSCA